MEKNGIAEVSFAAVAVVVTGVVVFPPVAGGGWDFVGPLATWPVGGEGCFSTRAIVHRSPMS